MRSALFFFLYFAVHLATLAQLQLPRLFADHMVFQRNQPTKLWGWSTAGQTVNIDFDNESISVKADAAGYFEAFLKPRAAGGPYEMTVSGDTTYHYKDILIGDVWIAGGQSNMEWQLQWNVNNWEEEVKNSNYPDIRVFKVPNAYAVAPQRDVTGGEWMLANENNSPQFSAVAWFFAKRNHLEKQVPVGIIESHWGGTPAEAWTTIETLKNTPGYEQIADTIINPTISWTTFQNENASREERKWELIGDQAGAVSSGAQQVSFDDSDWQLYDLPCNCKMTDLAWLRRSVMLSPDSIESVKLYISNVVQDALVFFNGELVWSKKWNDDIKPLDIPKELIRNGKNVIAYRVANSWDNQVYFGRPGEMWLEVNGVKESLEGHWKYSNDIEPKIPSVVKMFQMPSFLYNAKIAPIGGYSARGVIWYQGESNAHQPQYYHRLFANMIGDWRKLWGEDLAFLYVQLANFMERKDEPQQSSWAELREAQTLTLNVPKTGMALAIDIGNAQDIHPRNKQDVGARLWAVAKKVSYNEDVVYSGPTINTVALEGNQVRISFVNKGSGLKPVDVLRGFEVAGADGQLVKAEARIEAGEVIVWSEQVTSPTLVRYAWADNPACNLYNKEGLPAVPFRIKPTKNNPQK